MLSVSPDETSSSGLYFQIAGDEMSTLGERIKGIRKTNQYQIDFANMIGVSQGTLSELEQDKDKPSIDIIIAHPK